VWSVPELDGRNDLNAGTSDCRIVHTEEDKDGGFLCSYLLTVAESEFETIELDGNEPTRLLRFTFAHQYPLSPYSQSLIRVSMIDHEYRSFLRR